MPTLRLILLATLGLSGSIVASAQNLVANPGFEAGESDWSIFVPPESKLEDCTFTIKDVSARAGRSAARLAAASPMRFAIGTRNSYAVLPSERYRIAAWYRVEPGSTVNVGTPGFLLRANFYTDLNQPAGNNLHLGPGGLSKRTGREIGITSLPEKWTRLEAVIEIPEDVTRLGINCFAWILQGAVWVDDVLVERVNDNTPLTAFATMPAAGFAAMPLAAALPPAQPLKPGEEKPMNLKNIGFESGITEWDTTNDAGMSRSTPEATFRGESGLRVEDADEESGSSLHSAYLGAAPGRNYQLRFWARAVESEGVAVYLRFYDTNQRLLTSAELANENLFVIPGATTRFRQFTHEAVAPEGTAAVRVWIHSFNKAMATADFDEISLFESIQ